MPSGMVQRRRLGTARPGTSRDRYGGLVCGDGIRACAAHPDSATDLMTNRPALVVVTDDPTPPYEQLRRQLTELIQYGVLVPDERLPPLRQLAADLGLAVG